MFITFIDKNKKLIFLPKQTKSLSLYKVQEFSVEKSQIKVSFKYDLIMKLTIRDFIIIIHKADPKIFSDFPKKNYLSGNSAGFPVTLFIPNVLKYICLNLKKSTII